MYKGYADRQFAEKNDVYDQRSQERDKRKRSRSKSQPKEIKRKRQRRGPTDSDIEKTYTGIITKSIWISLRQFWRAGMPSFDSRKHFVYF